MANRDPTLEEIVKKPRKAKEVMAARNAVAEAHQRPVFPQRRKADREPLRWRMHKAALPPRTSSGN
jgi:hypothetical protein